MDPKRGGAKSQAGPLNKGGSAYQKAYKALQGGTNEEFSLAFTACINCSDSNSEASEELDNSAEDNEIQVASAYLLTGEMRNP